MFLPSHWSTADPDLLPTVPSIPPVVDITKAGVLIDNNDAECRSTQCLK